MGKGRAPCCDKTKVKKGPWSPAEDTKLIAFIQKHGHTNWRSLPKQAGLLRCGKSCRLRWVNYLRPDLKRGNFTPKEEQTIIDLHNSIGNKWSKIACHLPGRTDNEIKNVWNTHLKKRLTKKTPSDHKTDEANYSASASCDSSSVTSFGDQNLEKATSDQGCQESEIMNSHEKPEFLQLKFAHPHEAKDLTCASDSPTSSYASSFCMQSSKNPDDHGKIEIPWEPDAEFWELMDSLDPFPAGKAECDVETQKCCPAEGFDDNGINGIDFRRWIRSLETELGLTNDVVDHQPKEQNVVPTTPPSLDTKLKPETYPGFDYFPIWPSSPHNLGI